MGAGPQIEVVRQGAEGEPVVVIDHAWPEPDALIEAAAATKFDLDSPYFPGPRAHAPPDYWPALELSVRPILAEVFGYDGAPALVECLFSMVTQPAGDLAPIQRLPHFDSLDPDRLALLHYLGDPALGGTSFYRHRATGFETINAERYPAYAAALNADVAAHGLPAPGYMAGDTPLFERIASYEAVFNRVLIYRGATLHSGNVPNDAVLSPDPRQGRLTVNAFATRAGETPS